MKFSETALKEVIRKIVKQKLLEMDINEKTLSKGVSVGVQKRMPPHELASHLEKEKERSRLRKAQKERSAMKAGMRGMELECACEDELEGLGHHGNGIDDRDEEEEYLSKLESLILQSEDERLR